MADLHPRRESRCLASRARRLAGAARRRLVQLFDHVPTDCPLCLGASHGGGPCPGCLADMRAPMARRRCPVCALKIEHGLRCPDCAALGPAFDRVVAAFDYVPPVDQLIWQLKNASRFHHARFMAALMADAVRCPEPPVGQITLLPSEPSSSTTLLRLVIHTYD